MHHRIIGVPAHKIHLVFNRAQDDVNDEFGAVLNYAKREKTCVANPECAIPESEIFDMLAVRKISLEQALEDQTDYKAALRKANEDGDSKAFNKASQALQIQKMAKGTDRQLRRVFELLTA